MCSCVTLCLCEMLSLAYKSLRSRRPAQGNPNRKRMTFAEGSRKQSCGGHSPADTWGQTEVVAKRQSKWPLYSRNFGGVGANFPWVACYSTPENEPRYPDIVPREHEIFVGTGEYLGDRLALALYHGSARSGFSQHRRFITSPNTDDKCTTPSTAGSSLI